MNRIRAIVPALIATFVTLAVKAEEIKFPGISVTSQESNWNPMLKNIAMAVIFTFIGLALFGFAFLLMNKFCPFSIRKEIEEDQNTALAVLMGAVILGIAIIVAAAIHG